MSGGDYLQTGGISQPGILTNAPRPSQPAKQLQQEDLLLQDYGREFGGKATYSMGLMYGVGLFSGGSYGLLLGVRQGGATSKLFVNSVLNSCSRHGPALGNQAAIITLFYCMTKGMVSTIRGTDDSANAAVGGAAAGALYKSAARTWHMPARYAGVCGVFFTAVDFSMRNGYV